MGRWSLPLILTLAAAWPLGAQDGSPRLQLSMPPSIVARADAPTVSFRDVLAEGHRRELLNAGWPTVLHCRIELWKRGFVFYDLEPEPVVWDIIVEYVPATQRFRVQRKQDGKLEQLGQFSTIEEAEQVIDQPYRVPISPRVKGGRYYYLFSLDLQTLTGSDLEAWQRWVRGDAEPAIRGKANPIGALQHGLGSALSRVLGGETQHYERRSRAFSAR
jgi:hypothetical protein